MVNITFAGASDPGHRRFNNEDALLIMPEHGLAVVADGIGGAAAGEVASSIFVDTAREIFLSRQQSDEQSCISLIQKAFSLANERMYINAEQHPANKGMGCTAEMLVLYEGGYIVGHIGDSRTYRMKNGILRQITKDHSFVQERVDQGLLAPEEARNHPMKNIITRAVGISGKLSIDLVQGKNQPGDLFLLCSDGLTDMVDDERLSELLMRKVDLEQMVAILIEEANLAGGRDNITVALCRRV